MKKLLLGLVTMFALCVIVAMSGCQETALTTSVLTEQNLSQGGNAVIVRGGVQAGHVEGFIGSTWHPGFDTETGDISPPQLFSAGALYHWENLIDPNNPVPWIPPILKTITNSLGLPDARAVPYLGGQASLNIDEDAGLVSFLTGLEIKAQPDDFSSIVLEAAFNKWSYDAAVLPDDWKLNMGFKIRF
jgi:hypothetical protein